MTFLPAALTPADISPLNLPSCLILLLFKQISHCYLQHKAHRPEGSHPGSYQGFLTSAQARATTASRPLYTWGHCHQVPSSDCGILSAPLPLVVTRVTL